MRKVLLTTVLVLLAIPAMAQEAPQPMSGMDISGMKMDASTETPAALPEGVGKINSIDAEKHTVNVTHGPIGALKWPGMTMGFPVGANLDLSGFKAGDSVSFTLKKDESGQYSIVSLQKN